ncbi:hypothetical protein PMAYCL1PPCAC_03046 [Pristionchus mayeri]|uniref:C2H2-type domain-containing protein n=1 Tax=Pristionchus mayeri TaxID=1317129 RepID=A0AAN4Z2U3_9BILA|nr:hypothetical protein PMAYCL1PPCAC_03046 [Pristionchus mayeri]
MIVERKGTGAENLKYAVDSLSCERSFALKTEKEGEIPLRKHVYRLCEALEITIESVIGKKNEEMKPVETTTAVAPIEMKFTEEVPEDQLDGVVKDEVFDSSYLLPRDDRAEMPSTSHYSTNSFFDHKEGDLTNMDSVSAGSSHSMYSEGMGSGIVKEEEDEPYYLMEEDKPTSSRASTSPDAEPPIVDPNQCPLCDARFVRARDLKRHLKTIDHSVKRTARKFNPNRRKWYKCDKCPAEFTRVDNLNRHLGIHNGNVSLIQCPHCEAVLSSNLKGHLREVHKIDPYACELCGETFARQAQLKDHNMFVCKLF